MNAIVAASDISEHAHQSHTAKLRRTGSADWPKPLGQGRLADEAQVHEGCLNEDTWHP